jgi:hypothetical protein
MSTVLTSSFLLFAQAVSGQEQFQDPAQAEYEYAVKFVCSKENADLEQGLVPGVYGTAINVHNPSLELPVVYHKKFVRGLVFQEQGDPTKFERHEVKPNHAFEVECQEIIERLQGTTAGVAGGATATGYVVFMTRRPLDIDVVYTAGPLSTGEVASIDVERVHARGLQPQD